MNLVVVVKVVVVHTIAVLVVSQVRVVPGQVVLVNLVVVQL